MTDDLVKRLLSLAEEEFEMLNNIHEPLLEAASRIEQLEAAHEKHAAFIVKHDLWEVFVAAIGEKKDG